jgi:hypothetical protein
MSDIKNILSKLDNLSNQIKSISESNKFPGYWKGTDSADQAKKKMVGTENKKISEQIIERKKIKVKENDLDFKAGNPGQWPTGRTPSPTRTPLPTRTSLPSPTTSLEPDIVLDPPINRENIPAGTSPKKPTSAKTRISLKPGETMDQAIARLTPKSPEQIRMEKQAAAAAKARAEMSPSVWRSARPDFSKVPTLTTPIEEPSKPSGWRSARPGAARGPAVPSTIPSLTPFSTMGIPQGAKKAKFESIKSKSNKVNSENKKEINRLSRKFENYLNNKFGLIESNYVPKKKVKLENTLYPNTQDPNIQKTSTNQQKEKAAQQKNQDQRVDIATAKNTMAGLKNILGPSLDINQAANAVVKINDQKPLTGPEQQAMSAITPLIAKAAETPQTATNLKTSLSNAGYLAKIGK